MFWVGLYKINLEMDGLETLLEGVYGKNFD